MTEKFPVGAIVAIAALAGAAAGFAGGYGNVALQAASAKQDIDEAKNQSLKEINESPAQVPFGTIVAWHKTPNPKDLDKKLTLPTGWVECDGEPLPAGSPLLDTGATHTPDLNGKHPKQKVDNPDGTITLYGYQLFLRGSTTSGTFGEDTIKKHKHGPLVGTDFVMQDDQTPGVPSFKSDAGGAYRFQGMATTGVNGADETAPVNMSVVWIMRVK